MLRTGILALLLCVSVSAFGTRLYFPKRSPPDVIACEPRDPKGEVVYIDGFALEVDSDHSLSGRMNKGTCVGYDKEAWEIYLTNHWRKNEIKVGTNTDKGLVIEVKLPVVKIQTETSVHWFRVDDLAPEIKKPSWKKPYDLAPGNKERWWEEP